MESFYIPDALQNEQNEQILRIRREIGSLPDGMPTREQVSSVVTSIFPELGDEMRMNLIVKYMETEIKAAQNADSI